jgi:hypothetical protein
MPNWCFNNITIRHSDSSMIDRIEQSKGILQEFIPCPAELHEYESPNRNGEKAKEFSEKYGATDWYSWQVKNWGTKWDIKLDNLDRQDANTISASFDSAWSPPLEAYANLCCMGFEIEAYYYEPGMNFCGTWKGDEDDSNEEYFDLNGYSSDSVRDVIGEELDDMFNISCEMAEREEYHEE